MSAYEFSVTTVPDFAEEDPTAIEIPDSNQDTITVYSKILTVSQVYTVTLTLEILDYFSEYNPTEI